MKGRGILPSSRHNMVREQKQCPSRVDGPSAKAVQVQWMGESTVTRTRHGCLRQASAFPQRRWDRQLVGGPGVWPGYRAAVTLAKPGTI